MCKLWKMLEIEKLTFCDREENRITIVFNHIVYKVSPTASHIYFNQKSITLDYVLDDILMPFQYAQTIYVNAVLCFPDVYFVFL